LGIWVVSSDRQFNLTDSALESNQILLKLGLLLLDVADLILQFNVLDFLLRQIPL
jgi:hypothetical protein